MHSRTRQHAREGRQRGWVPVAWHKGLLLGVLFVLLSLCHGVVASVTVAAPVESTVAVTLTAADQEQTPFRDCAASKRLIALSERRGSAPVLAPIAAPLGFTEHVPEAAVGRRAAPPPLLDNHRAFLQVFRI